jgi:hypothetical protein
MLTDISINTPEREGGRLNKFNLVFRSITATLQTKLIMPPQCSFVNKLSFVQAAEWGLK